MPTTQKTGNRPFTAYQTRIGHGPHVLCPKCGKQIHFIKTKNCRMMPCEMELKRGDGRMTLVTNSGVTTRKAPDCVYGYEPHWGFCKR